MRQAFYLLFALFVVVACTSEQSNILSPSDMEDVLYDLHVAQSISEETMEGDYIESAARGIAYKEAVLKKHNLTEARWDSSYNYYCRHTEELHEIYENLSERLRNDVLLVGGDVATSDAANDTTNVWTGDNHFVLMQKEPLNLRSFVVPGDSIFKPGETITLSFNPQFIFQDGSRDLLVMLAVTLSNDSVVVITRHNMQDGPTTMPVTDTEYHGIKSVKGYFLLTDNMQDTNNSTLRLVSVYNIKLKHEPSNLPKTDEKKDENKEQQEKTDSANAALPEPPKAHSLIGTGNPMRLRE